MFRVAEEFTVNANINEIEADGLSIGKKKKGQGLFVEVRDCVFVKDYESRANYDKTFKVLNDDLVDILKGMGYGEESIENFGSRVKTRLLDEPASEPMTWRKWHEEKATGKRLSEDDLKVVEANEEFAD